MESHRFLPVFRKSVQQVVRLERGREIVDLDDVAKLVRVDVDAHVNKVVVARVLNANSRGLLQVRLNLRKTGRTVNNLREEATICLFENHDRFTSSVTSAQDALGRNSLSFSSLPKVR